MQKILVETRGNDGKNPARCDFFSAVLNPCASFGGLWSLESLPKIDLDAIKNLDYNALTRHIFALLGIESEAISLESYKNFDNANLPLSYTKMGENLYAQNLYTGPTRAFKDMAMQPFGALLCSLARQKNARYLILSATSGDTGPATLKAIAGKPHIYGICMYPKNGTSSVQRLQMSTIDAPNVAVLAVSGNFDDTQSALKSLLNDGEFRAFLGAQGFELSASNSVNFGRIAFQIIYHAHGFLHLAQNGLLRDGEKFNIVVPSGNFGNALGAFYAKIMGIPIDKIIIATNANDVLNDLISRGIYDLRSRTLIKTNSPAMDILKSSNVERAIFTLFGAARTRELMESLESRRFYELSSDERAKMQEFFQSFSFNDDEVLAIIRRYAGQNIIIDPHTANGMLAAQRLNSDKPTIVCSTAEWSKFARTICTAVGIESGGEGDGAELKMLENLAQKYDLKLHENIRALFEAPEIHTATIRPNAIKECVKEIVQGFK